MIEIGSRVQTLLTGIYSGIIGTVMSFSVPTIIEFGRIVKVKIDKFPNIEAAVLYKIGGDISFYEKDLELIRPTIDPNSKFQYCIKCDVLTSNKPNLCCNHIILSAKIK